MNRNYNCKDVAGSSFSKLTDTAIEHEGQGDCASTVSDVGHRQDWLVISTSVAHHERCPSQMPSLDRQATVRPSKKALMSKERVGRQDP